MSEKKIFCTWNNEVFIFVASDTIIAAQSGDFNLPSTWSGNVAPKDGSTVVIPNNVTVHITSEPHWIINIQSMRIYGKLQIGPFVSSPGATFAFQYPTNIMVFKGGVLQDLTSPHVWSVSTNTIITIYNGGSFIFSQPITLLANSNNSTRTFNSSIIGPYTIAIDLQGKIQSYSCKEEKMFFSYRRSFSQINRKISLFSNYLSSFCVGWFWI